MGWVKSMPGDVGEFSVNIGLGINFLAGGTLFFNSNDTLSYTSLLNVWDFISHKQLQVPEESSL